MPPVLTAQCCFPPSPAPPHQDVQTKLRDAYKRTGDEFMTNKVATLAKVCHACTLKRK